MYISVKEYAEKVGASIQSVRSAIRSNRIPFMRDGRRIYIDSECEWIPPKEKTGLSHHPLYSTWQCMKKRCYYKKDSRYSIYGGKGITVCDEWMDFPTFYDWAISHGWEPGLTIDRIDHNGNYEPSNCRFLTRSDNSRHAAEDFQRERKEKADAYNSKLEAELIDKCLHQRWMAISKIIFTKNSRYRRGNKKHLDDIVDILTTGYIDGFLDDNRRAIFYQIRMSLDTEFDYINTPDIEYIKKYIKFAYSCEFK